MKIQNEQTNKQAITPLRGMIKNENIILEDGKIKLLPGDRLVATVVDITPHLVRIELADGRLFSVATNDLFNARIGDELNFILKNTENGELFLELTENDSSPNLGFIKEALQNAKLLVTKDHIQLADQLLKANLPLNAETLKKALFFKNFSDGLDIDNILFLLKEDFAAIPKTAIDFKAFLNEELHLESNLSELITEVVALPVKETKKIMEHLHQTFKPSLPESIQEETMLFFKEMTSPPSSDKPFVSLEEAGQKLSTFFSDTQLEKMKLFAKLELLHKELLPLSDKMSKEIVTQVQSALENIEGVVKQDVQSISPLFKIYLESGSPISRQAVFSFLESLPADQLSLIHQNLENQMEKHAILPSYEEQLEKIATSFSNLLSKEFQPEKQRQLIKEWLEPFQSEEREWNKADVKEKMITLLFKELSEKDHSLNEYFNNLKSFVSALKKDSSLENVEKIAQKAENILRNLELSNGIQIVKHFFELPYSIYQKQNAAELHIFKKKASRSQRNQTFSALVSLNTAGLGHVEVFMTMTEKQLSFDFKVEHAEDLDLFSFNMNKLEAVLFSKGYKIVNTKYQLLEQKSSPAVYPKEENKINKYSFDIRV